MSTGPNDEDETLAHGGVRAGEIRAGENAPTEALVSGTVGDRCVNCGAPLSSDQRYCVVCGERRGAPRFSLPATAAEAAESSSPAPSRDSRRPRMGAGTTLIAGVATLLLAMLVGVLIGSNIGSNSTKTVASSPVKVITVGGGSSAAPTGTSTSAAGSGSTGATSGAGQTKHSSSKAKTPATTSTAAKTPKVSKQAAQAQSNAASKVTGGTHTVPATVTQGGSCSAGTPGCSKSGKENGTFFGGG